VCGGKIFDFLKKILLLSQARKLLAEYGEIDALFKEVRSRPFHAQQQQQQQQ
jgi:hypothetical protein